MRKLLLLPLVISATVLAGMAFTETLSTQNFKAQSFSFQSGDIIFQTSQSRQSKLIQLATESAFSHVGMVMQAGNSWVVYEAVQPVQKVSLEQWIDRGEDDYYEVLRLKSGGLTPENTATIQQFLESQLGKNYDSQFAWDDGEMYCSELVWKAFENGAKIRLCPTRELQSFQLSHPLVQKNLEIRYPKGVPLQEPVVAPSDLYQSSLLEKIKP